MKSVLALLCIVALANGMIFKDGGLKGSWTDTLEVTSDSADVTAPTVSDYNGYAVLDLYWDGCMDADCNYFSDNYIYNASYFDDGYNYLDLTFCVEDDSDAESDYPFYSYGGVDCMFWSGESMDAPDVILYPSGGTTTTADYDCEVNYQFNIPRHMKAGTYMLYCTAWDFNGNTVEITPDSFTDDVPTWTLQENDPDVQAPVLKAFKITGGDQDLDMTSVTTAKTVAWIEVDVDDGNDIDSDIYDPYSTDIDTSTGVWATVQSDVEGSDPFTVPLIYSGAGADDGDSTYGIALWFAANADTGVWTVTTVTARDKAGNMASISPTSSNTITLTYNDADGSAEAATFSCQSITVSDDVLGDTDPEIVVTASESDYVYVLGECTTKDDTLTNYVAVGYQISYVPDALTTDMVNFNVWNYYFDTADSATMGIDVEYADATMTGYITGDYDSMDVGYPGVTVTAGTFYDWIYFPSQAPAGDYSLFAVYTTTSQGAVQRYSLAEGAASSVVPSLFAVVFAALFALFRL